MVAYRPEIDGLRAVAVIPVVLFHLGFDWISCGYLGVDVFFVISGYLITQIIVSDLQAGTFSYTRFVSRRIRRIGPVLLAVVSAVLLVTYAGGLVYDFKFVAEQSISSLFFAANVYFWNFIGSYWGPTAEESVLLHTWSLSLEEQFYLVFPWWLVLIWRMGRTALVWSLALLMVGSVVAFIYATFEYPQAAFYLLPTRAWELLCGSLLAVLGTGRRDARWIFPGFGIALIVFAYFLDFDQSTLTANRFAAVIGSLMLLAFPGSGLVFKLLSWGPCVWIGKMSYSIYM